MGRTVVDFSFQHPDAAKLKAAGITGVVRYVSPAVNSPKNITPEEAGRLRQAGLDIALVYEWYAERPKEGRAAGIADAQVALAQANAIGFPGDRPIYAAIDWDASPGEQAAINAYMEGFQSVLGKRGRAAYGGYWIIKRLFEAGLIDFGWQTYAWSGGNVHPDACLYQNLNGQALAGGVIDYNEPRKADWGQWKASSDASIPPAENPKPPVVDGDYTVKSGDTLGALAAAWGTTVDSIIAANRDKYPKIGTGSNAFIGAGWSIRRPGTVPPASAGQSRYVVQSGDTLGKLAQAWSTPIQSIIDANKGTYPNIGTGQNALIVVGWVLVRPGTAQAEVPQAPAEQYHQVVSGDTNGKIAARYGTTVDNIVNLNKGKYPKMTADHVEAGWVIRVR